jgi:hypothetical protein
MVLRWRIFCPLFFFLLNLFHEDDEEHQEQMNEEKGEKKLGVDGS